MLNTSSSANSGIGPGSWYSVVISSWNNQDTNNTKLIFFCNFKKVMRFCKNSDQIISFFNILNNMQKKSFEKFKKIFIKHQTNIGHFEWHNMDIPILQHEYQPTPRRTQTGTGDRAGIVRFSPAKAFRGQLAIVDATRSTVHEHDVIWKFIKVKPISWRKCGNESLKNDFVIKNRGLSPKEIFHHKCSLFDRWVIKHILYHFSYKIYVYIFPQKLPK